MRKRQNDSSAVFCTMTRTLSALVILILLVTACVGAIAGGGELYGLATSKLATRDGPGTQYEDKGTYNVKGQYIRILSRAWDKRNDTWWVKCEIPYRGKNRVLWTGYKRFDSSTLPLESIPIEGENTQTLSKGKSSSASSSWKSAYRKFVSSGQYCSYLHNDDPDYNEMLQERDTEYDCFALRDLNGDGIAELFVLSEYAIEQVDVFTYDGGTIRWLGMMGGDNFFQFVFYYDERPEVFAALGGPIMDLRACTYTGDFFWTQAMGRTTVDADGEETIGIQMYVSDQPLYRLLYDSFVVGRGNEHILEWVTANQL